jgi:hypothetical protein
MKTTFLQLRQYKPVSLFNTLGRVRINLSNFNAIFSVKRGGPLINILKSLGYFSSLRLSLRRVRALYFLVQRLNSIYAQQGPKGLTLHLKACAVLTQQALGGHRELDAAKAGKCRVSRNNSGFPRIIPRELRAEIIRGNPAAMKLVLSIFAVHRSISFPGTPNLGTIASPFSGDATAMTEILSWIPLFVQAFVWDKIPQSKFLNTLRSSARIFPIFKSAPGMVKESLISGMGKLPSAMTNNFSTSPINILHAIRALHAQRPLFKAARDLAVFTQNETVREIVRAAAK